MDTLKIIFDEIKPLMSTFVPPLVETCDYESRYELNTNKPVIIANLKKPYLAFAALIIQSNYVGFYFMPIYTDIDIKGVLPPELLRLLKGKSCFHIKKTTPELLGQIRVALNCGFDRYQEHGWV